MVGNITDSMDMNLSKLQEMVKGREAWCATVQGHKESDTAEHLNNKHDRRECWSSKHVQRHKVTFVMAAGLVERLGKASPVTWGDVTGSDLCSRPMSLPAVGRGMGVRGWEAGDSVTCSPRQTGGQMGGSLRDPGLIHEMVGFGLYLSSKINGPV